jgi:hypothetical protein
MKFYHVVLFLLKIVITIQLVLIFFNFHSHTHPVFVISDAAFNIYVGALIMIYFLFSTKHPVIHTQDKLVFLLGGFLLVYNIDYNKVLNALCSFKK